MAVLGVTAIAVGTTTTKTIAQSGSTGGTTGGGPSSTASASAHRSVRHSVPAHGSFAHGTATTVTISPETTVERSGTTTLGAPITVPPTSIGRIGTAQYWPVPALEQFRELMDSPAAAVTAATVDRGPTLGGVGPVATAAVTGSPVLAVAPITLRPVPVVETPTAVTPAPAQAVAPVVMAHAVFTLAAASGLSVGRAWAAPTTQVPFVPDPSGPPRPVAGPSGWSDLSNRPGAPWSVSAPAEAVPVASEGPAADIAVPSSAAAGSTPPPTADGAGAQGSTARMTPAAPTAPTGGTAADADAASLQSRAAPGSAAVLVSGSAGVADARAPEPHPTVRSAPEVRTPPITIGSTTALETAAASIDSTDAAAAMQLAHALDASGKGFTSATWNEDSRSNAAVLRLGAAEAWSRHEKERAELFADARQASAGLRAQTGSDQLLVRQLVGGE